MSADNGIYILMTKDQQIRVLHAKAIENIFDTDGNYISKQVKKYFLECPYTRDMNRANRIAQKMYRSLSACEYGITILPYYDKTWGQIMGEDEKEYPK
ncbi:MAG: hypothetical protein HFI37_05835 [Lachnospiraceae bacterium]|nr:hypothetical protein [Lachnospiraceae bacterium]